MWLLCELPVLYYRTRRLERNPTDQKIGIALLKERLYAVIDFTIYLIIKVQDNKAGASTSTSGDIYSIIPLIVPLLHKVLYL